MANNTTLSLGVVQTMPQNIVFALPPVRCVLFCSTAGPVFTQSNDVAFGDSSAITLTAGVSNELAAAFIRNTNAASAIVLLKAAR